MRLAVVLCLFATPLLAETWTMVNGNELDGNIISVDRAAGTFVIRQGSREAMYMIVDLQAADRKRLPEATAAGSESGPKSDKPSGTSRLRWILDAWKAGLGFKELVLAGLMSIGVHGTLLFLVGRFWAAEEVSFAIVLATTTVLQGMIGGVFWILASIHPLFGAVLIVPASAGMGISAVQFTYESEWKDSAAMFGIATAGFLVLSVLALLLLTLHLIRSGAVW